LTKDINASIRQMEYKDYYKILGVNKNAKKEEIQKAFRILARKYHPDVNPDNKIAEEKFKEANEAYEVLSDPEKRKKYDQFGTHWQQYSRAGGSPDDFDWTRWASQAGGGGTQYQTVSPEDLEQILGGGFGGFSDFFETLFGMGRQRPRSTRRRNFQGRSQQPSRGRDSEQVIEINLEDAFHGTTRTLQWEDGRRIEAKIPPGVRTGSRIRLRGQGQPSQLGNESGDLYLKVKVRPHPRYKRKGTNLRVTMSVDLYTAILGGEIEVRSIDRKVKLTIPPETTSGKVLRLSGLGMPELRNPQKRGDLLVKVDIQIPTNLTNEEIQLFRKLKDLSSN
jgi:curved DNA-binding protein